ncbi:MAG: 1-acyl-sn-glycerol-3-phosphate acyltransferase [Cyanobacteria bacterium P01_E01_bin.35]
MSEPKFIPPEQNPLLVRVIQSIFYLVAYFVYKIRLVIDEDEVAKLKAIADHRVVYLPNHSNLDDGFALFLLSARIGQLFNYVVALEAFRGWVGKLIQKVGAYSIRRGVGDRQSIIQTLKILQQPRCKLVIFPEGGCSYQNDTVMPFRAGAFELSFKALDKLVNQNNNIVPDFYLVPVTLKYLYPDATDNQIEQTLSRLETALALTPQNRDFYQRLRQIGIKVLSNLEAEYRVLNEASTDYNHRISVLKQRMLDYCEEKLEITPLIQLPDRERVYKVQETVRSFSDIDNHQPSTVNYQHIYLTTVRLLNFDAIYDGYVAEKPTTERFFDTIDRLEREVFQIDRPKFKGRRQIIVKISAPINLKDYWQQYQSDRQSPQNQNKLLNNHSAQNKPVIDNLAKLSRQLIQANLN